MVSKSIAKDVAEEVVTWPKTDFTVEQADLVIAILSDKGLSGADKLERLKAEFANGLPPNGKVPLEITKHQFKSIIDLARHQKCEEVLLYMVEIDPKNSHDMHYCHNFMFPFYAEYPSVIQKLRSLGHSMKGDMGNERHLGLYLDTMTWSGTAALWPQMQAEGMDMNGHVLNTRNWSETLFLSKIAESGYVETIGKAIAAGCDPRKIGKDGNTILHSAIDGGSTISESWRDDSLSGATKFTEICDFVVRSGLDIDMKDAGGQSALHLCAKRGYANRAKILLEHGANADLKDDKGRTPLRLAKAAKRDNVVEVLGAWRANTAVQDVLKTLPRFRQPS